MLPRTPEIATALNQLNSDLMDITHLYEHFAEKFNLAECKLAIVHCAGHYDPTLIESLWRDIVDNGEWWLGIFPKRHLGDFPNIKGIPQRSGGIPHGRKY